MSVAQPWRSAVFAGSKRTISAFTSAGGRGAGSLLRWLAQPASSSKAPRVMSNRMLLHPIKFATTPYTTPVGAAEGCDLLILLFADQIKIKIKRSQPAAAPTH